MDGAVDFNFPIMIDCSPCCASSGHLRSFKLLPGCCRLSSLLRILGTYSIFYSSAFMSEKFLLSCFVYYETYLIALKMAVDFFSFQGAFCIPNLFLDMNGILFMSFQCFFFVQIPLRLGVWNGYSIFSHAR